MERHFEMHLMSDAFTWKEKLESRFQHVAS